jgi:hypothetical protein
VIRNTSVCKEVQVADNLGYLIPSILCSLKIMYYIHGSKIQKATTGWGGNKEHIPNFSKDISWKTVTRKTEEEMKGNIKMNLMEAGFYR